MQPIGVSSCPALPLFSDELLPIKLSSNSGRLKPMRWRTLQIVAALALLVCFVCPILETFDTWDRTIQTGNDSEYTLVVLALCVGVAYSFARLMFKPGVLCLVAKTPVCSSQKSYSSTLAEYALFPPSATSPPALPLRT